MVTGRVEIGVENGDRDSDRVGSKVLLFVVVAAPDVHGVLGLKVWAGVVDVGVRGPVQSCCGREVLTGDAGALVAEVLPRPWTYLACCRNGWAKAEVARGGEDRDHMLSVAEPAASRSVSGSMVLLWCGCWTRDGS